MQPTKEEIKLAPSCYDAIKVIVGERECPRCRGIEAVAAVDGSFVCPKCKGIGKVGWVWKPEVGEWFFYRKNIYLINEKTIVKWEETGETVLEFRAKGETYTYRRHLEEVVPTLPWETIEQILEGAGYGFEVWRTPIPKGFRLELYWLKDNPNQDPSIIIEGAKSRTQAVYEAVIALAKEIKNNAK